MSENDWKAVKNMWLDSIRQICEWLEVSAVECMFCICEGGMLTLKSASDDRQTAQT